MKKAYILPLIGILFLGVDAFGAPSPVPLGKNDMQTRAVSRAGSLRIGGLVHKNGMNATRTVKSLDGAAPENLKRIGGLAHKKGTNTTQIVKSSEAANEKPNVARASSTTRLGIGRYLGVPQGQSVSMVALPNDLMNRLAGMDEQIAQKQDDLHLENSQYLHFTGENQDVLDVDDEALLSALRSGHNIVLNYESGRGIVWYYEDDTETGGELPIDDLRADILEDLPTDVTGLQNDVSNLQNAQSDKMDKVDTTDVGKILFADENGNAVARYTFDELVNAVADEVESRLNP